MRLRSGLVLVTIGLLAVPLILAACTGGGGGGTTVVANDQYRFEPANLTVKVNQPATITLRNTGSLVHDWVVQGMPSAVSVKANGGQTQTVTFTPTQTGTFKVICAEPGHEQSGMVGQLTVSS
jgi:plastocyanin